MAHRSNTNTEVLTSWWPLVALVCCAGVAYVASAPNARSEHWVNTSPSSSLKVLSTNYPRGPAKLPAQQEFVLGAPLASSQGAVEGRPQTFVQSSKPAILIAASGCFFAIAVALQRFLPQRSMQYAMMATSGDAAAAKNEGLSISRRGMGSLFTGVVLSPNIAAQAMAAPAPAASAPTVAASIVDKIEDPKKWIADNLPGALPSKTFVRLTADILAKQKMQPENTVACVGVCRDELCQPLVDEIEAEWGDAFNMTSLGGMLTLGKTGLQAALAHSPVDENGRERYFFLSFPHIAVDTNGLGYCTRPGRSKPSKACGALYAFTNELKSGKVKAENDPIDPEYSYMKAAILDLLPQGQTPDLLEVTKTAAEASLEQMEQLVAATVDTSKSDYAVCVGVLVHQQDMRSKGSKVLGPAREYLDQVWPIAFYSVVNGRKKDLIWRLERD